VAQQQVSLARVLDTVQEEVATLATMSDGIQDALSSVLSSATMSNQDLLTVQNLDLIAQHLGALAAFVKNLSAQVPDDWAVRPELAAAMLTLSGLAQRLSLRPAEDTTENDDPFLF
jgi:hypothetical protein